ncbi:MAG: RNA pseudouridine synthase [Phycisphaerales bacterium]|nr:RNA pseudouridine synthase [Phycisphaerales bacterium]
MLRTLPYASAVPAPPVANPDVTWELVHEWPDLVCAMKPAGVVTQPGVGHRDDALLNGLMCRYRARMERLGAARDWGLLHRLDRETSGCVLCALDAEAYDSVRAQFAARTVGKTYLAVVSGRLPSAAGRTDQPLEEVRRGDMKVSAIARRGEPAITHWMTLASQGDTSLIAVSIETGKLHQIRAHVAWLGAPIVGDRVYRTLLPPNTSKPPRSAPPTLLLHAWRISCALPSAGGPVCAEAAVPQRFTDALAERLGMSADAAARALGQARDWSP